MFGKKENDSVNKSTNSSSSSINSLAEGTVTEGTLSTKSDIRIDGSLKGNLDCAGKLILGPTGNIEGIVSCQNAVIEGKINGNLDVHGLLDIKESAILSCDINTGQMRMQAGAQFQGKCQMGGQTLAGIDKDNNKSSKK